MKIFVLLAFQYTIASFSSYNALNQEAGNIIPATHYILSNSIDNSIRRKSDGGVRAYKAVDRYSQILRVLCSR